MAINNYVNSANIFVFPCANRKAGFWESKLATEYSLRTLIPWKITKPSFVVSNAATVAALGNDLEFVVNGYYFKITDWRNATGYTSGTFWAHIKLVTKRLTSDENNTEATDVLAKYDSQTEGILDDDTSSNFVGIRFDQTSGNDDIANKIFHLQLFDANGNVLHRDTFRLACKDPIKQDDETGELSLNYGNGLTIDTNNKLIVNLNSTGGLEFTGTEGQKTIQIKLPNNSGLEHDSTGLKITNVISDITAPSNILQKITIGGTQYTIPTYIGDNGINITDDKISVSLYTSNSDNTAYSGLEFLNSKLKVKTNTGLVLSTNGLGLQYPIPDISGQGGKFLSITGTDLTWATPASGTVIFNASTSYPVLKIGDGLTITTANNTSYLQMQYPLPDITNNKQKILAVTSTGDGLEWVTKPSGGGGSGTVTSIGITGNNGISVSNSPITSSGNITLGLKLGSTLQYSNNYLNVKYKSGGGLGIDNDYGLYISENSWNATCNTETFYLYAQSTDYIARATVKALTLGKYCTLYISKVELTSQTTPSTTFSISSMTAGDSGVRDRFLANTFYNSAVTFYGKNNHSIKLYVDDGINPHFLQLQFSPNITSDDWTDIRYVPITYILKN